MARLQATYSTIGPKESPLNPSKLEAGFNSETGFKSITEPENIQLYLK